MAPAWLVVRWLLVQYYRFVILTRPRYLVQMLNSGKPENHLVRGRIMARKRYSPEQIIVMLREAEVLESKVLTQLEVVKKLGICEQTLIRWKKE